MRVFTLGMPHSHVFLFRFIFWASLHSDFPYIWILFKWLVGSIQFQVVTLSVLYLIGIGYLFWCFRYLTLLLSIVVVVLRIQIYFAIHESNLVSYILCLLCNSLTIIFTMALTKIRFSFYLLHLYLRLSSLSMLNVSSIVSSLIKLGICLLHSCTHHHSLNKNKILFLPIISLPIAVVYANVTYIVSSLK